MREREVRLTATGVGTLVELKAEDAVESIKSGQAAWLKADGEL